MATKVFMEALSPTMEEGRLVKWLKNEGDAVASGDPLAEVETDKAIMELVARGEGVLRKRLIGEGESRPVGTLVGVIAAPDENIDALVAEGGGAQAGGASAAEPATPAPAQATPATGGRARAKPPEQPVAQTEDAAPTPAAAQPPPPSRGGAVAPSQARAPERRPSAPAPAKQRGAADGARSGNGGRVRSSPLARRLASEQGLDLGQVQGSGPGGRIIKRDIEEAAAQTPPAAVEPAIRPAAAAAVGDFEDVALTQIRKTIARRLSESIGPIPTFYLTAEVDVTRMAEARSAMAAEGDEFKASFNDIILKAVATALREHREVNAHWLGDRIRYHNRVHVGMAVATDEGLIVPVIFDADQKSLREIGAEARELAKRARERKLTPEQYTGGTFSVSNLGMFGIDQFTAIINPPEAGILAIGAIEEKPVVVDGAIVTRQRLRVTMSCDHRVIDGAVGARFLQTLRRMLENPLMLVF
jgi:pyruvate dehydrogenase E2 component (dihydrolipoamide acetyltransferase)